MIVFILFTKINNPQYTLSNKATGIKHHWNYLYLKFHKTKGTLHLLEIDLTGMVEFGNYFDNYCSELFWEWVLFDFCSLFLFTLDWCPWKSSFDNCFLNSSIIVAYRTVLTYSELKVRYLFFGISNVFSFYESFKNRQLVIA